MRMVFAHLYRNSAVESAFRFWAACPRDGNCRWEGDFYLVEQIDKRLESRKDRVMALQRGAWLTAIAEALRGHGNDNKRDPLPRRWVELIHHLNEQELQRSAGCDGGKRVTRAAIKQ